MKIDGGGTSDSGGMETDRSIIIGNKEKMTMKRFITLSGMKKGGSIETVHKGFLAESCQNYRVIVRQEELISKKAQRQ